MKRFLTAMLIVVFVLMSLCMVSYAAEADKPLGSSAYYVPVDSSEFELYVNQSGSLVVAGMDLTDNTADVSMYATVSYKMPDGEMVVQDIRKMNAYKSNPMPCVAFEIDEYYAAFCDLYITFIDSDTLKPYVEAINVNEYFAIDAASYQTEGIIEGYDYDTGKMDFACLETVYDENGGIVLGSPNGEVSYESIKVDRADAEKYFKQRVKITFAIDESNNIRVINMNPASVGNVLEISPDMLDADAAVIGNMSVPVEYYESDEAIKATKIYVSDTAELYVNGVFQRNTDLGIYADYDSEIRFVENNGDKYYDAVLVTVYEHGIVEFVDTEDPTASKMVLTNGSKIYFDFEDTDFIIDITDANGKEMELADFKPGDLVAMVVGDDDIEEIPVSAKYYGYKIKVINLGQDCVEGMITEISEVSSGNYIYIDGIRHFVSPAVNNGIEDIYDTDGFIVLGMEGYFYIGKTGSVVGFCAYPEIKNYGYILRTNYNTSSFEDGWEIKMLTKDGIKVYTLYRTVTIDGTRYSADNLTADSEFFAHFTESGNYLNEVAGRIVDFELNATDTISVLNFHASGNNFVEVQDDYRASIGKIGTEFLAEDVTVFDISQADEDDTRYVDISSLTDDTTYSGYLADETEDGWKLFVITAGMPAVDSTGDPDDAATTGDGYILRTYYSTSGIEPVWKIKLLTEEGSNVYTLSSRVRIDGEVFKSNELESSFPRFAGLTTTDDHQSNPDARIVEYGLNANGEIVSLEFYGNDNAAVNGIYSESDRKISEKILCSDALIIDASDADEDNATFADIGALIDGNTYKGYLFDSYNDGWYVFVVTDGVI